MYNLRWSVILPLWFFVLQEQRVQIARAFHDWIRECHELHDKQVWSPVHSPSIHPPNYPPVHCSTLIYPFIHPHTSPSPPIYPPIVSFFGSFLLCVFFHLYISIYIFLFFTICSIFRSSLSTTEARSRGLICHRSATRALGRYSVLSNGTAKSSKRGSW